MQLQQLQQAQAVQAAQQQAQDIQAAAQNGSDIGSQGVPPSASSVMNLGPGSLGQLFDWGAGQTQQQGLPASQVGVLTIYAPQLQWHLSFKVACELYRGLLLQQYAVVLCFWWVLISCLCGCSSDTRCVVSVGRELGPEQHEEHSGQPNRKCAAPTAERVRQCPEWAGGWASGANPGPQPERCWQRH